MKKSALRTSFRSATQATDSTRKGWIAKIAATNALRQVLAVIRRRTKKSKSAAKVCSRTGKMMTGGIQPKEVNIEHVGKGGKGMPISRLRLSEGCAEAVGR
jgi:hypothetical protein